MEVHDGELVDIDVVELYGSVPASSKKLVLVDLGPGEIILGVVCIEAFEATVSRVATKSYCLCLGGQIAYVFSICTP